MNTTYQTIALVIPSLEPSQALIPYVTALADQGFSHIYIVNDGSSSSYDPIFNQLSAVEGCTLLTHSKNCGKGAALKTAYIHIARHLPHCTGVVTADSDGQHGISDVCHMADGLLQQKKGLLLGSRNFSQQGIPLKSWVGNRLSSLIFMLLNGRWVQDTQTGLRGFDISLLPLMQSIPGDRFEYEMAVLTTCTSEKTPIHTIFIDTIYLEGNASTHFRPLADSLSIGGVLLGRIARFMLSSGLSCAIDLALCWMLLRLFVPFVPSDFLRIGLAVILARLVSMTVNYRVNRGFVFHADTPKKQAFQRYFLLAVANVIASTLLTYLGATALLMGEEVAKVLADTILFIINYQVQRIWVFSNPKTGGNK